MLKIFSIIATLLANVVFDYKIVEKEIAQEEIVEECEGYKLLEKDSIYYIERDEKKVNLNKLDKARIFKDDNQIILLSSYQEELMVTYFNLDLVKNDEIVLVRMGIEEWDAKIISDVIYIYGSSNENCDQISDLNKFAKKDCFLGIINNKEFSAYYYGGGSDEEIVDLCLLDNNIYICGYKGQMGEGDLGNGGKNENNIYISKINNNYEIEKTIVLDALEDIISIDYYNDCLIFATNRGVYKITKGLMIDEKIEFLEIKHISLSKDILTVFLKNELIIYDFLSREKMNIPLKGEIDSKEKGKYKINNTNYYFDVILIDSINQEDNIYSIFGKTTIFNKNFYPHLDKQVYGNYKLEIEGKTINNIPYVIDTIYNIEREVNVRDGGIYPLGYRLIYTGRGYLNGKSIINNYSINEAGSYILELIGCNNEIEKYAFEVMKSQIEFDEGSIKESNVEVKKNEKFALKVKADISGEVTIKEVIINGKSYQDVLYDSLTKILFITMEQINETGIYEYKIEKVIYDVSNIECEKNLDLIVKINVVNDAPEIDVLDYDDNKIIFKSIDIFNTIRKFVTVIHNEREEYVYNYPVHTSDILLNKLTPGENYIIDFYVYADLGGANLTSKKLFTTAINEVDEAINFGQIEVLSYNESLEKFSINISSDAKEKISIGKINDKIIIKNDKITKDKYILICVLIFSLGFIITVLFKKNSKNKDKAN